MTRFRVELTDDITGEVTGEVPKGNDRMFDITLFNRRRGNRRRRGTATIYRYLAALDAIKQRHPRCVQSAFGTYPLTIRVRRGGPIVMTCRPLDGPVASVATKQ
jgi:hypothetical protein